MNIISSPSKIDFSKLDSFVTNHPNGNFFQSSIAYNFFNSINNYDPIIIVIEDKNKIIGSLLAVIIYEGKGIKKFLSSRCIIWGSPLASYENIEIIQQMLLQLDKIAKNKVIYIEFRNFIETKSYLQIFKFENYKFTPHLNYVVHTTNIANALSLLSSGKKRQVKKGLKNGAIIKEAENLDEVKVFYKILYNLYKFKIKKPIPSFVFFKIFFEQKDIGKFFLISFNNKIIGGIMCPIYKHTIYEWYVCGLDSEYKDIYPSILATWAPIEYASKNGLKYFDFMGAGKPEQDYGVRKFKSQFGGKLVNYGRYIKINKPLIYFLGKIALNLKAKFNL